MNTHLDTDPDMLDLVARTDPMRDPRVQSDAGLDTESALRLLSAELDRPPAAPRGRRGGRRRRRRPVLRIAMLPVAVAAATFVVANVASTGSGSAVAPAQAKEMLRRALDALPYPPPPNAILEEDTASTLTAPDGTTSSSETHQWFSTSPPYRTRTISIQSGKEQYEQSIADGRDELYDPATNTVYVEPPSAPTGDRGNPLVITAVGEVHYLLGQHSAIGRVTVNPNATLNGAPAIEFTFVGGRFSYWVSPGDYRPLQSVDRADPMPGGKTGVSVDRYVIERVLTGAGASPGLLSLEAQHPDATVDHSSADYSAIYERLFHAPVDPNAPASRRRRGR